MSGGVHNSHGKFGRTPVTCLSPNIWGVFSLFIYLLALEYHIYIIGMYSNIIITLCQISGKVYFWIKITINPHTLSNVQSVIKNYRECLSKIFFGLNNRNFFF